MLPYLSFIYKLNKGIIVPTCTYYCFFDQFKDGSYEYNLFSFNIVFSPRVPQGIGKIIVECNTYSLRCKYYIYSILSSPTYWESCLIKFTNRTTYYHVAPSRRSWLYHNFIPTKITGYLIIILLLWVGTQPFIVCILTQHLRLQLARKKEQPTAKIPGKFCENINNGKCIE